MLRPGLLIHTWSKRAPHKLNKFGFNQASFERDTAILKNQKTFPCKFDIFNTIGSIYTKLEDFVKLGLHLYDYVDHFLLIP